MGLGTMFFLTPTVGWAFPLLWPALMSAAGALGYKHYTAVVNDVALQGKLTQEMKSLRSVVLPLENVVKDIVSEEVGREQVLRFVKDDIVLIFKKDMRGKFSIEVMGPETMTQRQLELIGMEFASNVIQQFAYNKMAVEMERKGASIVEEEVNERGDIVLKLRRWD